MTALPIIPFDPELDLQLVRVVDVPPALVWKAYTTPELLMQWFCPRPWGVAECVIDLRPGGRFYTVMRSPEGETFPGDGCCLDVQPERRLVFTSAMTEHYRPVTGGHEGIAFTAYITLEPEGTGTRYTAHLLHADAASRQKHADMGFEGGWGAALDQLVELMAPPR